MASSDVLKCEQNRFTFSPLSDPLKGDADSRGMSIEKRIEFLESLNGKADAFTESAFKGNPAGVCVLEEERDDEWLQALAAEFNLPLTCYLLADQHSFNPPKFSLRWFTSLSEVTICGHATLAAAHILFSYGLVNSNIIEFSTLSGILTAKKVLEVNPLIRVSNDCKGESKEIMSYFIELDFPTISWDEVNSDDVSSISKALNVSSLVDVKRFHVSSGYLLVVLPSEKDVLDFRPNFDEIRKFSEIILIITGVPLAKSKFDFYSRFFAPKVGVDEDEVCGSAHCALASYWANKLGKSDFVAYAASSRSGVVSIHLDEQKQRVLLRGKVVTIMEGVVLV